MDTQRPARASGTGETDGQPSEGWRKGICGICPAGCWVEVGRRGRPAGGDPAPTAGHPLGHDLPARRARPRDRLTPSTGCAARCGAPARRGRTEFEPISWDEAYDAHRRPRCSGSRRSRAPRRWRSTPGAARSSSRCATCSSPRGVAVSSASNVLFPFGSPNTMGVGALCYVSFAMIAPHVTMGRMLINMFTDIENAELLRGVGRQPGHRLAAARHAPAGGGGRRGRRGRGHRSAPHRDRRPHRRASGSRSGPGTDGALALGMIEVLIDEELLRRGVRRRLVPRLRRAAQLRAALRPGGGREHHRCAGRDDPRPGAAHRAARPAPARSCTPASSTPTAASRRSARCSRCSPWPASSTCPAASVSPCRARTSRSTAPCNVAEPRPGPGRGPRPVPGLQRLPRRVARQRSGRRRCSRATPTASAALIVHGASLLTSWPQTPVWRETLARLDFLVCIDRQLTADAAYADVVLPATTMFEIDSYMVYGPIFRLREKLIEPVGEARNDYLIMAELARRLGYGDRYPADRGGAAPLRPRGLGLHPRGGPRGRRLGEASQRR